MNKLTIQEKTSNNGGLLHLQGLGINRSVLAYGELIASGVDWGYDGAMPYKLSESILKAFLDAPTPSQISDTTQIIVQYIPQGSFDIYIKIDELIKTLTSSGTSLVHAYEFMYIKMGEQYYSKYLDFANMCAKLSCTSDTVEYQMYKALVDSSTDLKEFTDYLRTVTLIKMPNNNDEVDEQYAKPEMTYHTLEVINCLGKGTNEGTQVSSLSKLPDFKIYLKNE